LVGGVRKLRGAVYGRVRGPDPDRHGQPCRQVPRPARRRRRCCPGTVGGGCPGYHRRSATATSDSFHLDRSDRRRRHDHPGCGQPVNAIAG
jgi:hypothetical protein